MDKIKTVHDLTIARLVAKHGLEQNGFNKRLKSMCESTKECYEEVREILNAIPDAWSSSFDEESSRGVITVYEVEDTHPMDLGKLTSYAYAYDSLTMINIRLIVCNRWGIEHEVDLGECAAFLMYYN